MNGATDLIKKLTSKPVLIGAGAGGALGLGLAARRLSGKDKSRRQKWLDKEIAKQFVEVQHNPTALSKMKLKKLQIQRHIATFQKRHPLATATAMGSLGAGIGAWTGKRISA